MTELELTRRERKKDETKRKIFLAAVKLFRDKGFDATTVDEITERADVAKGTFFNYFPRKEAVLGYLSEVRLAEAEHRSDAILEAKQPIREKILALYTDVASAYEEDRELSRYALMESMRRMFQGSHEVHQRWHDLLVRVIEQGQATGEIRREVNPHRAEHVLGAVYMGSLFMWLECTRADFNLTDEIKQRLSLVLDGLATSAWEVS